MKENNKKAKKILSIFLILVTALGIGITIVKYNEYMSIKPIQNEEPQAYQNSNNILDDIFTQNGTTLIPFIYKNPDQTIGKTYIKEQFDKKGLTIKNSLPEKITTGTKIETEGETYTSLIYGDVDEGGDGKVDAFDAQAILLHYVSPEGSKNKLTGIYKTAANVENDDDEIDAFDAQRILAFYVGNEKNLVLNPPNADKNEDREKPVITLKGENPQKIKLGQPYVELGATVTDNVDKNIKLEIDTSELELDASGNTKTVGTYIVYYNAKDASGNQAETKKRTVTVEDYVKEIKIENEPTKTTYEYKEKIDVTGGEIKVIYASGKTEIIPIKANMISGYDSTIIGVRTITVTYGEQTTTFKVEITPQAGDYVEGIKIIESTIKKDYKIGQTLDLTGAKFKKIMHSGIPTSEEDITQSMITVTTLDTIGQKTITVTYKTTQTEDGIETPFTDTFTVQVSNYIKEIEIITPPTNTTYKHNEPIKTAGMVVNAIQGDNTKIDITSQVTLDISTATIGTNKVTVSYQTSDTIDGQPATLTAKFTITVQNYVTGIEIATPPTKNSYVEGQTIEKTGMVVKAVMANGDKQNIDLADITLVPSVATYGTNTISASYTTTNTIDDASHQYLKSFNITIINKIQNINVTPINTTGYRYDTISVAKVKAGDNEEEITTNNLSWEIRDSNNQLITDDTIAKITPVYSQFDGTIEMRFVSSKKDTYTITPKVTSALGDVVTSTKTVSVKVTPNPKVTKITIGNVQGNFRVGHKQTLDLSFFHEYFQGEREEIGVEASRIEVTAQGLAYKLRDKDGNEIGSDRPNTYVKAITIEAIEQGTKTLTITVDKGNANQFTENKTITVLQQAQMEINLYGLNNITLYKTMPTTGGTRVQLSDGSYAMKLDNGHIVTQDSQGFIYTAIPFSVEDEDGKKTNIKAEDLTNILSEVGTTGKLSIIDNMNTANDPFPRIQPKGYKKQGDLIQDASRADEIQYIGIALIDEQAGEELRNGKLALTYGNATKGLNVTIPKNEIANIIQEPDPDENGTITGIRYESIKIAKLKSGLNEEAITTSNLSWEIYDSNNHKVTDETIAKIKAQNSQFGETATEMYFTSSIKDTYTVIPKVTSSNGATTTAKTITVKVNESKIVNEINIGEVQGTFQVGQTKHIKVEFLHQYQSDNKPAINVEARRIKIIAQGYEYKLLDANEDPIIVDETQENARPNAYVKYISLKATTTGTKTISIIVDDGTDNKKVESKAYTITEKLPLQVKLKDVNTHSELSSINFYNSLASGDDIVKADNGSFFTLAEISLEDSEGNSTPIKAGDLAFNYQPIKDASGNITGYEIGTGKTISFIDSANIDITDPWSAIIVQGYRADKEKASAGETIKYVGIAVVSGEESFIQNGKINIHYEEMQNPIELGINITY